MKKLLLVIFFFAAFKSFGQNASVRSPLDPLSFGVVLDDPGMKDVIIKKDIPYIKNDKGSLSIDIYSPPHLKANEKRPAIIFLNAIGEFDGERKVKSWGIYSTWPKLMAARGYIGISMETDGSKIQESIQSLFDFLEKKGTDYGIDATRLGVYAASANVTQSLNYLMSEKACRGIKAAVMYYGGAADGPFRKDLPVLFVVSEGDVARNGYGNLWNAVLKNNAPWTIRMGTGMPHAFDAYADNDDARKIIKETINFWKDQLDPVPVPSWPHSKARDVHALLRMDLPKALQLLKEISEEYPRDVLVISFYAEALREAKRTDESIAMYKKVLDFEPVNTQALVTLSVLSYAQNKDEEAEKYISSAVNSGKMTAGYYGNLAFSLLSSGRNKEAAIYYEKALALRPNGHDYYNLGCAYAKYGEKDKALAALDKCLEFGYASKQMFETDSDLVLLRTDERFKTLLQKIK